MKPNKSFIFKMSVLAAIVLVAVFLSGWLFFGSKDKFTPAVQAEDNGWKIEMEKKDWQAGEAPVFKLDQRGGVGEFLRRIMGFYKKGERPKIKITLKNPRGEEREMKEGEDFVFEGDDLLEIRLIRKESFYPGSYVVGIEVEGADGMKGVFQQNFLWGVLAINPDKAVYRAGEIANLALAVLDEEGMMVCDAELELEIRNQKTGIAETLSTENGKIRTNPECEIHDFTTKPDYEADYETADEGTYGMKLTAKTKNGIFEISDSFEVSNKKDFYIRRVTATRIYPVKKYPVTINIEASRDFKGKIVEAVPESFDVEEEKNPNFKFQISNQAQNRSDSGKKEIIWEVDVKKGEKLNLGYVYDAPDVSPEFFLLGPLSFVENGNEIFTEGRKWQIASDYVTIDNTLSTTSNEHLGSGPTTVFISDQTGYSFYVDSGGDCRYMKTTNGGTSWSVVGTGIVDAQADINGIAVWYDQWTPGDISGTYIHILTWDAADVFYTRLNTSGDSLTTTVNATDANQGGAFTAGGNIPSITKATDGDLYMGISDASDSFVIRCASGNDCATLGGWSETASNPFDLADDWVILMPLASGNIMAIRMDISANAYNSKIYTDSGTPSWSGSWANIDNSAPENGSYDAHFGATLDKSNNYIYLAYAADVNTLGGMNDDIRTAIFDGSTWTRKTEVVSDSFRGITDVKIAFDQNKGDVYVVYAANESPSVSTSTNLYWKKSINGMESWIGIEGPSVATDAGNFYGLRVNIMSDERIYATWYEAAADDLFGDTLADLSTSDDISIGTSGLQTENITVPAENQYIGAFTFIRDAGSANVTSITFNEEGSVNANSYLSNLDVYYEIADSCSYDGNETLFGTAASFNASDQATVTGTMAVGTSQVCAYLVLDVASGAKNSGLNLEISAPGSDISFSSGTISQRSSVGIEGGTVLREHPLVEPAMIDSSVSYSAMTSTNNSTNSVFLSDLVGYVFFVDSDGQGKYSKTIDGGASWSSAVAVDSQTDVQGIAVWYDRWTPGDDSGTYIHIATFDSGGDTSWYARLNTSNDNVNTATMTVADQAGTISAGANNVAISKATDGKLFIALSDDADYWVHSCDPGATTCTTGTNWSEITNPFDAAADFSALMPLASGNMMLLRYDVSGNDYDYQTWSGSAWSGTWTTIATTAGENTSYDPQFGVSLRKSTGDIYLAYVDDSSTLGGNDDIETWLYSSGSWSAKGNVVTNDTRGGLMNVSLAVDQNNGDVYAAYSSRSVLNKILTGNIYFRKSTNGMTSWSNEGDPISGREGSRFGLGMDMICRERIYITWNNDGYSRVTGTTVADIFSKGTTFEGTANFEGAVTFE